MPLVSVFQNYGPQHVCLLPFLTHFADLSSWEYAKKLKTVIPQLEAAGTQVVVVGLGSRQNALAFSKLLDFPLRLLYAGKPSSLPQSFCVKTLHQQPSTPVSYPTVAAWPAMTVCTITRTTAMVCLHYRAIISFASVLRCCNISMGLQHYTTCVCVCVCVHCCRSRRGLLQGSWLLTWICS